MNNKQDYSKFVNVRNSSIHGKGIFTSSDIPAGENIMVIRGEVISEQECVRREDEENNVYIFWNGDNYIDANNSNIIKYINHKCDCNCEVDDNDDSSLLLISAREIKMGEELTIDYGYDEIYDACKCEFCV